MAQASVLTVHYIHNNLRETIEDIGFLDPTGNEGYLYANPGEGLTKIEFPTGKTPPGSDAEAHAEVRRIRARATTAGSRTTGSSAPTTR